MKKDGNGIPGKNWAQHEQQYSSWMKYVIVDRKPKEKSHYYWLLGMSER